MKIFYNAFGLGITSERAIPGMFSVDAVGQIDLQITFENHAGTTAPTDGIESIWYESPWTDSNSRPGLRIFRRAGTDFRLCYHDGTEFRVNASGSEIRATWPEDLTLEDTTQYLLGPVIGFTLRLRGSTCLHASVVAFGDHAVALAGDAGAGKSTLAAAFAMRGFPVLSDDIAVLSDDANRFWVQPAYPRIRLWPSSVETLFDRAEALPRLTPTWDKRFLDLTGPGYKFESSPLPLAAVYVLADRNGNRNTPRLEDLPPGQKLMSLIANSYGTYLLDHSLRAGEFELLSRIAVDLPVRQIRPHEDAARLSELCEIIAANFQDLDSADYELPVTARA